jgi:hypothetical protein
MAYFPIHNAAVRTAQSKNSRQFAVEYLRKIEIQFKNIWGCYTHGPRGHCVMKKSGRKSPDTVSLN